MHRQCGSRIPLPIQNGGRMKKWLLFLFGVIVATAFLFSKIEKRDTMPKPLIAYLTDGKWHFIDDKGNLMFKPKVLEDVLGYSEGYFRVNIKIDGRVRWAIMDLKGKVTPVPFCNFLFNFYNGRALASIITKRDTNIENEEYLFGFINTKGELVIPFMYKDATEFSEGLSFVMNDSIRGYIDTNNRFVFAMKNAAGNQFKEGYADINNKDFQIGYINKNGEIAIPLQFDVASPFSEGLAFAVKGTQFGFINKNGNFVFFVDGYVAKQFSDGLSFVGKLVRQKQLVWRLINSKGDYLSDYVFEDVREFSNGYAAVKKDGRWLFINRNNEEVFKNEYSYIDSFVDGKAWVSLKNGKQGFIDTSGVLVVEIPRAEKYFDLRLNRQVY